LNNPIFNQKKMRIGETKKPFKVQSKEKENRKSTTLGYSLRRKTSWIYRVLKKTQRKERGGKGGDDARKLRKERRNTYLGDGGF